MTKPRTEIEHSARAAVNIISDASTKATTAIAEAAQQASNLLASQAAAAVKVKSVAEGNDHDTLIEIKTIQQTMLAEIREIKDGTTRSISDHEFRINKIESSSTRMTVMLSVGIFAITFLVSLVIYHLVGSS